MGILRVLNKKIVIVSEKKIKKLKIGTRIFVEEDEIIEKGKNIATYDPFNEQIITEKAAVIKFKEIIYDKK